MNTLRRPRGGVDIQPYSFFNLIAVWDGWLTSSPGRLTPGKDPVPIAQEAGWSPGSVWTGAENLAPTGIRSQGRPACSESLYRLRYPAHKVYARLYINLSLNYSYISFNKYGSLHVHKIISISAVWNRFMHSWRFWQRCFMKTGIFRDITSRLLLNIYRRFGRSCYFRVL